MQDVETSFKTKYVIQAYIHGLIGDIVPQQHFTALLSSPGIGKTSAKEKCEESRQLTDIPWVMSSEEKERGECRKDRSGDQRVHDEQVILQPI